MRTARLVAIPLILLLGAAEGRGQESKPDPRRTERDRLVSEIAALRSTGKRAAAVDRLERLLVLERDLFGEVSEEVVVTTDSLAVLLEMQGEVDAARERRKKVIEIRTALSGPEHWKTVDARRALADLEVRAALTPEQRRRLAELPAHERRFHVLYQAGRKAEAVEPGMAILAIHEVVYGPEHPNTAASLCNLGLLYCSTGDPGQSHEFLLRARAIFERILGPDHPETASSLNNLALLYSTYGARDRAIPLYRRALAIRRKVLGSDHADTGLSLFNLATALGSEGPDADEALRLLHESLAVYERRFGPEHPETAPCLGRIGEHHESRGEFAEALRFHERALRIHEKGLGAEHPRTATSLGQLAEVCASLGRLDEAVAHQRRALAIREKVLGPNHHATAIACTDLAGFLESKGEHREALALYERARGSIESVYGPDHPRMASLLNDLAVLRKAMGRYAEALSLYTRALEIWEKKVGPEHPNTAASLNNLAQLYRSMGDLDRARPLYERTLAICEKVLGPEHPHTVMTRGNLSGILVAMGDYEKALSIRETVLAYCERKLGPEHPHTIVSLGAVAELLSSMGAHDRALPLFERALRSAERTLGPKHPRTAITLNDLAILLDATGDHDRARRCYERSLAIDEERYGPEHPETALNLENFALFLGETGETERAHRLAVRSLRAHRTIAETVAVIQAERQQLREFRRMKFTLDLCLSTAGEGNVDAVHSAVLAAKGLVLARQSLLRARRSRPELAETFEDYEGVCRRLSSLLLSASDRESAGERLEQVRTLIERQEALEAELAAGSEDFRRERESRRFASADVAATLPEGAVLIDFLAYDRLLPRAAGTPGRSRWERCYVAFVLRPGGDPVRVDLGPAQPIDDLITAWRREVLSARAPGAGARLRELLWEPLREHLGDATSVILSPDDALSRLPFAALPGAEPGSYLVDRYAFRTCAVPRLLARGPAPTATEAASLLVVGDVAYGAATGAPTDPATTSRAVTGPGLRGSWKPLAGTRPEMDAVRRSFTSRFPKGRASTLREGGATEEAFRREAGKHRWLHAATHGFFAPAKIHSALEAMRRGARGRGPVADGGVHPGVLSGIVLAGANRPPPPGADDGILTALEVASLDLSGTEMVVLSACETGLGEVAGGEGVLGLQRAFQVAGARSTVTSLWAVDDRATSRLMTLFYEKLWVEGLPRAEALRRAQLELMRNPDLHRTLPGGTRGLDLPAGTPGSAYDRRLPPLYWAAFVLSGDGR
jgi:CHAT domain-containing protein/tetratricopeptide (TPR) repeat protein